MLFDDCLGEKQPQADTFALGGKEGLEDVLDQLGVDSGAGVRECYGEMAVVADESDVQMTAFGHRLGRIGDDVDEAGPHLFGVDVEFGGNLDALFRDLDTLALELRLAQRQHAFDELPHVGRRGMNFDRLTIVEEGLDHIGEAPHLVLHNPELAHEILASARELGT